LSKFSIEATHGSSEPGPETPTRKAYDKRIGMTSRQMNLPQSLGVTE
jgi:hypothetical protein